MATTATSRIRSPALGAASVLAWAATGGSVLLLAQQDTAEPIAGRIAVVAAVMLVGGLAAATGAFAPDPSIRVLLGAAVAGGLVPLGVLAAFSIGLPLLVAGLLALAAAGRALPASGPGTAARAAAAAIAAAALLAVGFLVT